MVAHGETTKTEYHTTGVQSDTAMPYAALQHHPPLRHSGAMTRQHTGIESDTPMMSHSQVLPPTRRVATLVTCPNTTHTKEALVRHGDDVIREVGARPTPAASLVGVSPKPGAAVGPRLTGRPLPPEPPSAWSSRFSGGQGRSAGGAAVRGHIGE